MPTDRPPSDRTGKQAHHHTPSAASAQPPTATPWWDRRRHQDRRPFLLARNSIKSALRDWFLANSFIEVETAALQISPGNETHLHAFKTRYEPLDGAEGTDFYLHTSPEFACKKLLAAGETRIFNFAPAYRNRERGRIHHPEFTMLEWYRTDVDYHTLMADCADILRVAAHAIGASEFRQRHSTGDIVIPADTAPEEISIADAFDRFANIDLQSTYSPHRTDREALMLAANAVGIRTASDDTWSDIFTRILVEKIEPNLGLDAPTILKDYPIHEAALAAPSRYDPMVAERFEVYLCDLELANAFTELSDPAEQRRRFEADMSEKYHLYGERYPIDEDFLSALAHMPAAAGCAMGFDRLVMLATGAERIDQVIWTPLPLD
jgi:lysyl-tRNA synthetase class 2